MDKSWFAMYFSRAAIPYIKSGGWKKELPIYRHVGLYVCSRESLLDFAQMPLTAIEVIEGLEPLRFLENGYRIKVVETKYSSVGVDTPEDLANVKKMMLEAGC